MIGEQHQPGWIATRVGISPEQVDQCLKLLAEAGQIRRQGRRWRMTRIGTVDTRQDPAAAPKLGDWCARRGAARLAAGGPGDFAFNLFAVSVADLERLRQLQRDYFSQLRFLVAASQPAARGGGQHAVVCPGPTRAATFDPVSRLPRISNCGLCPP